MKKIFLIIALFAAACRPTAAPPPSVDAGCAAMCIHGRELGCEGAKDTTNGISCEERCNVIAPVVGWHLDCRIKAPTCQAIDACEKR